MQVNTSTHRLRESQRNLTLYFIVLDIGTSLFGFMVSSFSYDLLTCPTDTNTMYFVRKAFTSAKFSVLYQKFLITNFYCFCICNYFHVHIQITSIVTFRGACSYLSFSKNKVQPRICYYILYYLTSYCFSIYSVLLYFYGMLSI